MDADKLELFANEIESHLGKKYEMEDVRAGMRCLMYRRRSDGETAFPDLGTFIAEAEKPARKRRVVESEETRLRTEAAEREYRLKHPDEYCTMRDVIGGTSLASAIEATRKN
ncbi:MAG: hypothetical protein ACYCSP_02870 [Acidobacteriaceae bacterium]